MSLLAAIAISVNLIHPNSPSVDLPAPRPSCGVRVVSHKFFGPPNTEFRYAGTTYTIPESGWIELISDKGTDWYEYGGRQLPLKVFPVDGFGMERIHIPWRAAASWSKSDSQSSAR